MVHWCSSLRPTADACSGEEAKGSLEGASVLLKLPDRLFRLVVSKGKKKLICCTPPAGAGGEITIKHLTEFKQSRIVLGLKKNAFRI